MVYIVHNELKILCINAFENFFTAVFCYGYLMWFELCTHRRGSLCSVKNLQRLCKIAKKSDAWVHMRK